MVSIVVGVYLYLVSGALYELEADNFFADRNLLTGKKKITGFSSLQQIASQSQSIKVCLNVGWTLSNDLLTVGTTLFSSFCYQRCATWSFLSDEKKKENCRLLTSQRRRQT